MVLAVESGKERAGDSKILNHRSDFQRNNAIRLRCFNGNSIINGNLKWAWTVGYNMPITLIFVALNCGANFEKVSFNTLDFSVCLVCWRLRIHSVWVLM